MEVVKPESSEVVVPGTGEIVNLYDAESCARALHALRDFKQRIDVARAVIERSLAMHARDAGTKTLHVGGLTVTLSSGRKLRWDVEELEKLLDAGLPEKRYNELVKTEVSYRVDASVAKSIEASGNEEYAAIISRARAYDEGPQRASVV